MNIIHIQMQTYGYIHKNNGAERQRDLSCSKRRRTHV